MQEVFLKTITFDCHGQWKCKNIDFNPNGFFESYSSTLDDNFNSDKINGDIILFGKNCDFWSALKTDCDWLFTISSSLLMDIHNLEVSCHYEHKLSKEDVTFMKKSAMCSRSNIAKLLYYTDYYLKICLKEKNHLSPDDFVRLEVNLNGLRKDFLYIAKFFLNDEILLSCSQWKEGLLPSISYQLVHCCLDFQWYYILIKFKLNEIKYLWNYQIDINDEYSSKTDMFLVSMLELILISIIKYKWEKERDSSQDFITCPCIKEFWVLLFNHLGLEAFWDYFNQILSAVLDVNSPPDNEILKTLCILSSHHLSGRLEDKEFTIHFLWGVSRLKDHIVCKIDYPLNTGRFIPFFDNVKQYLNCNPSEKSLRVMLRVIGCIMNEWELEKEHIIVLIWEHMYKYLDLPLHVPGGKSNETLTNMSGKGFLGEIKKLFLPNEKGNEEENSFDIFLRIMAVQVQKKRSEGCGMKNFHSRIYLKYDVLKKFQRYKELALYRTSSLFLTAAIAYGVEKETKKLRDLMMARKSDALTREEKVVKWKTLVACLLLLAENGCCVKELSADIITEIRFALWEKDLALMPVFTECLTVLIDNRNNYLSALSVICMFIDGWIDGFLEISSGSDRGSFLSIFDPLVEDLKTGPEWWSIEDAEGLEKQLSSHVLPAVKRYLHSSTAKTAALFLSYLIKTRKCAQSYSLYNSWLHSKDVDTETTRKFITCFYEIEGNVTLLGHCVADYDVDIIQIFIKEHIFNEQSHGSYRLKNIIQLLPRIARYTKDIRYDWFEEDCALDGFIRLFGVILKKSLLPSEKNNVKELFNKCLSKLEGWIDVGLTNIKTKSVVNNIYRCSGLIAGECHSVIFEESRGCLLKTIVNKVFLPIKKYKSLYELPSLFANSASEHLPLLIHGLLQLSKKDSAYIKNVLMSVINFSFPTEPYFTEDFFKRHPFYKCLNEPDITLPFASLLRDVFLTEGYRNTTGNAAVENVIRLFSFISFPFARDKIFSVCVPSLIRLVMELNFSYKLLKYSTDYIEKCIRESDNCRQSFLTALEKIAESELSACSESFPKLLRHLRSVCPREIRSLVSFVKQQMDRAQMDSDASKISYLKAIERDLKNMFI